MEILVFDDSLMMAKKLGTLIGSQIKAQGVSAIITIASNIEDLEHIDFASIDLAFLDIEMGQMGGQGNGIDLARRLHTIRPDAVIVFVTNNIEYAPSGYEVNAFRYILKNAMEETLPRIVQQAVEEYKNRHRIVSFSMAAENVDIPIDKILYLESDHRIIIMHVIDYSRKSFRFYASITLMETALSPFGFLRVHKSFLVNMEFIEKMQYGKLRLKNGIELPVSKSNYTDLKQQYIAWRGGHRWNIG